MAKSKGKLGFLIVFVMLLCSVLSAGLLIKPKSDQNTEAIAKDNTATVTASGIEPSVVLDKESDFVIDENGVLTDLSEDAKAKITESNFAITFPAKVTEIQFTNIEERPEGFNQLCAIQFAFGSQIETIGDSSFMSCSNLQSVDFENCSNLKHIGSNAFNGIGATELTLPESLETIGASAFYFCKMSTIVIPNSVESIGANAFGVCRNLTTVTFDPEQSHLKTFGNGIFSNSGLTSFEFPDGLTEIPEEAFSYCSSLKTLSFGENSNLTKIGQRAFKRADLSELGKLPKSLTTIEDDAFQNSGIKTLDFEENSALEKIGIRAFEKSSLTQINLPQNLKSTGNYAFSECDQLKNLQISEGVTEIGAYAFAYCDNLQTVKLADSVETIQGYAFYYCSQLSSFEIGKDSKLTTLGESMFEGYTESAIFETFTIPKGVTEIPSSIFAKCKKLQTVEIKGDVTKIGDWAFASCLALQQITLPDSVTEIDDGAFNGCSSLKNGFKLPSSLTKIGNRAFKGCSLFEEIQIPNGVTQIGDSAFEGCTPLRTVTINRESELTSIGSLAFKGLANLQSIFIPGGVSVIGEKTFQDCTGLATLTLSSGLTEIGDSAFENCSMLVDVQLPDTLTQIGEYAFRKCVKLAPEGHDLVLPRDLISIGRYAFEGCSVLSVVRCDPDCQLQTLHSYVFKDCSKLTKALLPDTVTELNYSFYGCQLLTVVTVGEGVTTIASQTFYDCKNLVHLYLPGVTRIEQNAFSGCTSLKCLYVPNLQFFHGSAFGSESTVLDSMRNLDIVVANKTQYESIVGCTTDFKNRKITYVVTLYFHEADGSIRTALKLGRRDEKYEFHDIDIDAGNYVPYFEYNSNAANVFGKLYFNEDGVNTYYVSIQDPSHKGFWDIIMDKGYPDENHFYDPSLKVGVWVRWHDGDIRLSWAEKPYTGEFQIPELVFKFEEEDLVMIEGIDYTIEYYDEYNNPCRDSYLPKHAHKYYVLIQTLPTSEKFIGYAKLPFEITKVDLSQVTIDSIEDIVYDGEEHKPVPRVTLGDYVVNPEYVQEILFSYDGDDWTTPGEKTITLAPGSSYECNFTGSREVTFNITKRSIESGLNVTLDASSFVYNGSAFRPNITGITVSLGSGRTLTLEGSDYTFSYGTNTDAGKGTITINAQDSTRFTGTYVYEFTIERRSIASGLAVELDQAVYTYSGAENKPNVTSVTLTYDGDQTLTLENNIDYVVTYSSHTNAGNGKVNITAKSGGNYIGSFSVSFLINPRSINTGMAVVLENTDYAYTGSQIQPAVSSAQLTYDGTKKLTLGSGDYTLTFGDNLNVGQGSVTLNGSGNYTGSVTVNFTISKAENKLVKNFDLKTLTVGSDTKAPDVKSQFGEVTVKYFDASGKEYTFDELKQSAEPGTYKAVVTVDGTENYSALNLEFTFEVEKKAPSNIMLIAIAGGGGAVVAAGGVTTLILLRRRKKLKLKKS